MALLVSRPFHLDQGGEGRPRHTRYCTERHRASKNVPRRPRKRAPPPPLPDDDYKIYIRPCYGLNLRSRCAAQISDSVRKALKVSEETTAADVAQLNYSQNTILVSTPDEGRTAAYAGIAGISLGKTQYEVRPYVKPPNNTAKGIVRGIPDCDTQEVTMRSLEQNNPHVVYARQLGNTSAIIVLFEGTAVPHYIKYRGTIMRCVLYKKKIEACDTCLRTGHRKHVCPTPNVKKCHKCGLQDPLDGHECKAKCAVCGGPHETRSNDCRRRFATPPIVRQRKQQNRQHRRLRSRGRSRSPSRTTASLCRERRGNDTTVDHPPPH
ncbi:hypothetical protein HPB49_010424 [Dermacentor silvarum]|uniref:Uncharacterized protein n=1 Tax=Dermacentor silvarum TaxID=543639 RepID=A0ACB8DZA8_DERSI|nr:hypothetical protein HPB49_010424 [Dermacentor silvarum]